MKSLTLVVPDLFRPLQFGNKPEPEHVPQATALCEMLSRGERSNTPSCNSTDLLFRLFNVTSQTNGQQPIAAITRLADFEDSSALDDGWYLRMDPVHLQPDRDHLVLLDNYTVGLQQETSTALVKMLNDQYQNEPFTIQAGGPGRWYLSMKENPQIHTHPLADVAGRNIDPFLLTGTQQHKWQTFMTEVQMLLHSANQFTTTNPLPALPVNSIWLWGEGTLAALESMGGTPAWHSICANDALARGLAIYCGETPQAVPESATQWLQQTDEQARHLVVIDACSATVRNGHLNEWQTQVEKFNDNWVLPVLSMLKQGVLDSMDLYEGNGRCYRINRKSIKRWWKRTGALPRCI